MILIRRHQRERRARLRRTKADAALLELGRELHGSRRWPGTSRVRGFLSHFGYEERRFRCFWASLCQQHGPARPKVEGGVRDGVGPVLRIYDREPRVAHEVTKVRSHVLADRFPMPGLDDRQR